MTGEQEFKECWMLLKPISERQCGTADRNQERAIEVRLRSADVNWDKGEAVTTGICAPSGEMVLVDGHYYPLQKAKFSPLRLEKTLE